MKSQKKIECHYQDCNKSYTRKDALVRHQVKKHSLKKDQPTCEKCLTTFKTKKILKQHQKLEKKCPTKRNLINFTKIGSFPQVLTIFFNENNRLQPADFYLKYAHQPLVIRSFQGITFDFEKFEARNFEVLLKDKNFNESVVPYMKFLEDPKNYGIINVYPQSPDPSFRIVPDFFGH